MTGPREDFEQYDYAAQEFDEWTVRGIAKKNLERGWATPISGDATRMASLTDTQRKDLRAKLGMNGEKCQTCGGPLAPWEGTTDAQYCAMCYIVSVVITPEIQPWQWRLLGNLDAPRMSIEGEDVENTPAPEPARGGIAYARAFGTHIAHTVELHGRRYRVTATYSHTGNMNLMMDDLGPVPPDETPRRKVKYPG